MRGRKPKPTWLKVIGGNPGRRPLNFAEPKPEGDLPTPPEWLTPRQRGIWETAIAGAPAGLLRRVDESVFLVWVVAKDLHQSAAEKIAQSGTIVRMPNSNMAVQSPWVAVLNKQAQIMLKASAEMGFTPSSRARVRLEGPNFGENKFARLTQLSGSDEA